MLSRRRFLAALAAPLFARTESLAAANPLKITDVEPVRLSGNRCFVLVRTDGGLTGLGECSPMNGAANALLVRDTFKPLLLGRNPLAVERCWEAVYYRTYKQGPGGVHANALSGVDIALWDILGQVAGLPLSELFGGRHRDAVRVYASIGGGAKDGPASMADRARKAADQGFTAVKIRMNHGPLPLDRQPERDLETLRAVRSAVGPGVELKFDVNNGYTAATAIRVGRRLADPALNVIHYEEPVAQTDYAGYRQVVAAVDVPVAAGEHEYTRWQFRDLVEQANPDILQPDVVKCCGLTEAVKIAALASLHHKPLVPHQTQPTVGTAANLHFCAAFAPADTAQELTEDGHRSELHDLFAEPLRFDKGRLAVPTRPGLGLMVDEAKLRKLAAKA